MSITSFTVDADQGSILRFVQSFLVLFVISVIAAGINRYLGGRRSVTYLFPFSVVVSSAVALITLTTNQRIVPEVDFIIQALIVGIGVGVSYAIS